MQTADRDPALGERQLQEWMTSHAGPLVAPFANQLAFLRVSDDFWLEDKNPAAGNHTAHYEIVLSVCIARIFGHPGDPDRFKL